MFEKLTERARKVISYSGDDALKLGHGFIGTEHIWSCTEDTEFI